jgi:hypothetical protein
MSASLLIMLGVPPASLSAQDAGLAPTLPPTAQAVRVNVRPNLDGNVLEDPAWSQVPVIAGFWQTTPSEGAPASEKTEVRVSYTADTLYVGLVAYDRTPEEIIVSDSRRDAALNDTDSFLLILDTYRDRQNGFVFGTNPVGLQYDGQVSNEGQGTGGNAGTPGGQISGSGGGFNLNWDADWHVRTRITEIGWSAEFAIPFRTLRYPQTDAQTWGVNFQRNIRRRNETAYWAPITRQYTLYRLSLAGQLSGLKIPAQRNLQVTPYALGERRQSGSSNASATNHDNYGVDVKYGITPSLTLDGTVNTDFAQVEVDDQQVNLDRFTLFFPEKRPFFLENAGLFAVGTSREAEVFFSRRIGIGANGEAIPIRAGGRLSGNVHGTNIGLLNIQTDDVGATADNDFTETPANNYSVVRVNRELRNRSAIGAIFVNRQATTGENSGDDYNRSYAIDGRWGIGRNGLINGFLAKTSTPDMKGREHAFRLTSSYNSQAWTLNLTYGEVGESFNPEVGFVSRDAYRKVEASVFHRYRPKKFWSMHELRPHTFVRSFWDFQGFHETVYWHIDNHWEMKQGHEFHTGVNVTREGLRAPFEIYPGVIVPPGTYDHAEAQLVFFTNPGAPLSINTTVTAGGFFGGRRLALLPTVRLRLGDALNTELRISRNDISLPGGDFVTNLIGTRVSYSFNPSVFVQALLQYNDRAELWSTNLRFGWFLKGSSGLFLVYNDTQGLSGSTLLRPDRSFTVKISRMFDLLD